MEINGSNQDKEAEIHNLQSQLDTMKKENTAVQAQIKKLETSLEKKVISDDYFVTGVNHF